MFLQYVRTPIWIENIHLSTLTLLDLGVELFGLPFLVIRYNRFFSFSYSSFILVSINSFLRISTKFGEYLTVVNWAMAFLILINYNFQNIEVLVQNVATQWKKLFMRRKNLPINLKFFWESPSNWWNANFLQCWGNYVTYT